MKELPDVKVGQWWECCDRRGAGKKRRGQVQRIESFPADKPVLQAYMYWNTGRATWIRVARMRPTSTGYKLVGDGPTPPETEL